MVRTLYILNWTFSYGSASSNRLLAYANSASVRGIKVEIVALLRLDVKDCQPNAGVTIRGLYPCKIHNKLLSKFISFFSTIWFLLKRVHCEDIILLYGSSEYLPFCAFFKRKHLWFEVTECPDLFPPKTYPFRMYRWLWGKVNGIMVISSNLKNYFINYGIAPEKVHVINMIVDKTRFINVTRDSNAKKYIAYCGNIVQDCKDGVDDLLHAFVDYHKSFPDRVLIIIGRIFSEEVKTKYIDFLESENIKNLVVFTGAVSPNDIPEYFVNAEMLVLARPDNIQAKYGFPTKVGEYLLSGRPCVLTKVGNISDFLTDGVNAYLAEAGNIRSIADKMKEVSKDEIRAGIIGASGKDIALKEFNSTVEVGKLLDIIM